MRISLRHYQHPIDYRWVDAFLTTHYQIVLAKIPGLG